MSIYCCSDLHGQKDLYDKIFEIITPEDTLIIIGDLCDRGKYGYDMMKDALSRDNVLYLKGNHEDLFVQAAREYKNPTNMGNEYQMWHRENGGKSTFKSWILDGANMHFINQIAKLDTIVHYTNKQGKEIIISHSGSLIDPLWDRQHFIKDEPIEDNTIIVHGHTSVIHLLELSNTIEDKEFNIEDPTIIKYNNGQKIDIDLLSAYSHKAALLNLDTLSVIYIK